MLEVTFYDLTEGS